MQELTPDDDARTINQKRHAAVRKMLLESIMPSLDPAHAERLIWRWGARRDRGQRRQNSAFQVDDIHDGIEPIGHVSDGRIDWSQPACGVLDFIRQRAAKGAYACTVNVLDALSIRGAQMFYTSDTFLHGSFRPGDVMQDFGEEFVVKCLSGAVLVREFDGRCPYLGDHLQDFRVLGIDG